MKRFRNMLLLLSLPLALIVIGLVGLLREPSAQFKMKINTGDVELKFNKVMHNVYGPVRFDNFLFLSMDDEGASHLGTENLSYLFPNRDERFKFSSEDNIDGKLRLSLQEQNSQIEIRYDFPDGVITDEPKPETALEYATSLKPSIHYTRRKTFDTSFSIFLDDGRKEEMALTDMKESYRLILWAFPKRSVMGEVAITASPKVSYQIDPKKSLRKLPFSLIVAATEFSCSNARGLITIGRSRWVFDTIDGVTVRFKKEIMERSRLDLGAKEGELLKLPTHLLTIQCDNQQCWIKAEGEVEEIRLNNQHLKETLFGIGVKWFWGALAGGLIGALVSLYMDLVKRTSRRREA